MQGGKNFICQGVDTFTDISWGQLRSKENGEMSG